MSKVRFVNAKGAQVFLNKTLANNPTYLKRHKLTRDEIKTLEDAKPPKEEKKEEVKTEKVENFKELDFEALKVKYKEVFNKKHHHSWNAKVLDKKINDKLKEDN